MKKNLLLLLTLLITCVSFAQTNVTGRVTSAEDGTPVILTVMVKGTSTGGYTDIDGRYSVSVPNASTAVLVFSGIGYETVEIPVNGRTAINVTISASVMQFDDVIVTGYGRMRRSEYTGSAANVGMDKVASVPTVSVGSKLAGATSGVQVTATSGMPGAVETVRIRGMGSINASNEPLYVVDGIPISAGNSSYFSYASSGNSLLSSINSADIESITVIKDAAAASLYGSRAANGVIVITTKKGKSGKAQFTFSADAGFSDMAIDWRPTKNGPERYDLLYTAYYNYAAKRATTYPDPAQYAKTQADSYGSEPDTGWEDWKSLLFKKGAFENYRISLQAGNDKTKVYSSLGYTRQEGITIESVLSRYTGNLNLEHKEGNVTLGASMNLTVNKQEVNMEGTSYGSPLMGIAMTTTPSDNAYNADGTINTTTRFRAFPSSLANPLNTALLNWDKSEYHRIMSNIFADYQIIPGLNVRQTLAYDFYNSVGRVWWSPMSNDGRTANGNFQRSNSINTTLTSKTTLSYTKTFANHHNLDALVAYEIEDRNTETSYSSAQDFPTPKLYETSTAAVTSASGSHSGSRMISYVGRVNYNYNSKYYFGASFRRDGTSRMVSEERWGNFWSLSGSWKFTSEPFMAGIKNIISDGRVRLSYGINGTLPTGNYDYFKLFSLGNRYAGVSGMIQNTVGNELLTWEKNYATNIGIELVFLKKISLNIDWYNRDTEDLLYATPLSRTSGFSTVDANVAKMNNTGIEFDIRSVNISTKDFSWITSLNIGHNKNKITYLSDEVAKSNNEVIDGQHLHRVGEAYYSYYLYEYAGVDPQTGRESYYMNKPGQEREITTTAANANRILIGSPDPKISGGITNEFSYKGIDLNFTFTYSLGGKIVDRATWLQTNGGANPAYNIPSYYDPAKMWKNVGDIAELPVYEYGLQSTYQPSTRWMMSKDHLRLKNLSLGYRLPANVIKSTGLNRIRVYMSASNLLTFTAKGMYLDPEGPINGLITYQTPALRTITFGLEIGF